MLKSLNKEIKLPKLNLKKPSFKKLKLPKLSVSKAKVVSGGIVAVDPYQKLAYNFEDNIISKGSINFYDRKNFYSSYIYLKDFISGTIEISRGIGEEDLKDSIEIACYDEFGLDSSYEYLIKYIELHGTNSENRVFNIFAIPYQKIDDIFEEIDDIKHLDFLTPAPLLYSTLYKKDFLPKDKVECFIHFDYEDAILAVYDSGEFIYAKSLTHSLKKINEEFAKMIANHVDERDFFRLLKEQGLDVQDSQVQKQFLNIFSNIFSHVNDILAFVKRSYNIDDIECISISSKIGDIRGITNFCENYTSIKTKKFDIKVSKNATEVDIDPMIQLLVINSKYIHDGGEDNFNISIYKKEPPFFTTPSGILTKYAAAGLALSLLYPAYQMIEKYQFDNKYNELNIQNQNLEIRVNDMKIALETLSNDKKAIEEKLKSKNKELSFRTKLLKEIYNKKVAYNMKIKILNDLFAKVNKHNNKVVKVSSHEDTFNITVQSGSDKKITEFIKDISQNQKYSVGTELIKKDDNKSIYQSLVKVGINEN